MKSSYIVFGLIKAHTPISRQSSNFVLRLQLVHFYLLYKENNKKIWSPLLIYFKVCPYWVYFIARFSKTSLFLGSWINMIDVWPQSRCRPLWPIFHGPVILSYILKTISCMNIIVWDYGSVWLDIWPLWPIFHAPVLFSCTANTFWCISVIFSDNVTVWPKFCPLSKYVNVTYILWSSDFA